MAIITGTVAGETLTGTSAADTIYGLDGDDILDSGGGADTLYGGLGNDVLIARASAWSSTLQGGDGDDTYYVYGIVGAEALNMDNISDTSGFDTVHTTAYRQGFRGIERIYIDGTGNVGSEAYNSELDDQEWFGNSGVNVLRAGGGNDIIHGGDGDDILVGGTGADIINGDSGTDRASYENSAAVTVDLLTGYTSGGHAAGDVLVSIENLSGGNYDDTLRGDNGDNELTGGYGADVLEGRGGNDTYVVDLNDTVVEDAGGGIDTVVISADNYTLAANFENLTGRGNSGFSHVLTGNGVNNVITGGGYHDTLYGLGGDDTLRGGSGSDLLDGGIGDDVMEGGSGNDTYVVDSYSDVVTELASSGTDTVQTDLYYYALGTNVENLTYTGTDYISGMGNALANVMTGGGGDDYFEAGDGNDTLIGGAGDDILIGSDGDDILVGGVGWDYLNGAGGADTYRFSDGDLAPGTAETVADFETGIDKLDLSRMDADIGTAGNQAFTFIGGSAFSHTAGELRFVAVGGTFHLQGDTDGDGAANFVIELYGTPSITSSDVIL